MVEDQERCVAERVLKLRCALDGCTRGRNDLGVAGVLLDSYIR